MTYTPRDPADTSRLTSALRDLARRMITVELEAVRGNRSEAARRLGISRRTLQYKIEELEIDVPATHGQGYTAEKRALTLTFGPEFTCTRTDEPSIV